MLTIPPIANVPNVLQNSNTDLTLKIVTWNCNGGFRKKFEKVSSLDADIYVIQECENPAESANREYIDWAENFLWIGDSKSKGLGVFAKPDIVLNKLDWTSQYRDHFVKHFLPCRVNGAFDLLAVWTHRNNSPNFGYMGQFWKYLQVNKENFKSIIIAGDFNSNKIWDQWDRWWNHSDVVNELGSLGIESLYHKYTGELQGSETKPTLFFQKNPVKAYHIDYVFASKPFSEDLKSIEIGHIDSWLDLSDHMPIVCEFK
jgi:exonuclease III